MGQEIKAVFLDIDGTIVTRDGRMPASAKEALEKASENGHQMVLCTGRSRTQIFPQLREEDYDGVIASAGANIFYKGEPVWRQEMDRDHLQRMVTYFRKHNMSYFLQAEAGLYSEEWAYDITANALRELGRSEEDIGKILGGITLTDHPEEAPLVEKCCYFHATRPADVVQADLGDYYKVIDSSFRISRFCDGEITMNGVNKASGMERYLQYVGIPHENSIAIGDGPNDVEMVEYAHLGIAMGNGVDLLKQKADLVCGHIEEDGLYKVFEELGLI